MAGTDIDAELGALADMPLAMLRARWVKLTDAPVPQVSEALLRMALAYELQAASYGGLTRHVEHRLKALGRGSDSLVPAAGTRLVREWGGALHTVIIGEDGSISWNGKDWNSLSEVARAITGTRWSGPAFFGLKPRRKAA